MTFYIELVCLSIEYDQFVESQIHHVLMMSYAESLKKYYNVVDGTFYDAITF